MIFQYRAFTLVELIVVITIVWILSTVGFVSYSGYLTGARDSNRFSQLTKLSDSLQTYAASKSLPLPDDYVEITASGASNVIAYQWYVWVDVLETIDYTNGGKDPKDDSYFTYYLTKDRNSLQLLTLMEDNASVSFNNKNQLFAADYSERYPKTYGKELWTLTNLENLPIQEISIVSSDWYLDIFNTNDIYKAHFWGKWIKSGTWEILGLDILWAWTLIWKWSFDEGSWNISQDSSEFNRDGVLAGTISPNYIAWKKWTALNFEWSAWTRQTWWKVIIDGPFDFWWSSTYSFGFWMKPDNQPDATWRVSLVVKTLRNTHENAFEFSWDSFPSSQQLLQSCSTHREWNWRIPAQIQWILDITIWNHITCVFGIDSIQVYVNWVLNNSIKTWDIVARKFVEETNFVFWAWDIETDASYFNWWLDEVYVFDKALDAKEVELLYIHSQ